MTRAKTPHRYQRDDVPIRGILISAAGLGAGVVVVALATSLLLRSFASHHPPGKSLPVAAPEAPGPHLQSDPAGELTALMAITDARLNSYGWVDRNAGTIHIPIDDAIQILATRGWSPRGSGQ